jgi:hemolysin activation/secretion protein
MLVGRGIPRFGVTDDDMFVSPAVYAGLGSATSFAAVRVEGEARKDRRTNHWDSFVGSGRLAWYVKPAAPHVLIGSVEVAGGRRLRVPFQLALGDRQGGVRGYAASRSAGAARGVARLEERWSMGRITRHGALGLASFADAGRVWAGDAPFGAESRTKIGVGVGLLAASPPQSPRLWRVDLSVPVSEDPHARWEVRLSSVWTRAFWREPRDVARGRAGAAPSTIFTWP